MYKIFIYLYIYIANKIIFTYAIGQWSSTIMAPQLGSRSSSSSGGVFNFTCAT